MALLFENVEGFSMPVLINAFGTAPRMAAALGVERLDEVSARVAKLLDLRMPGSLFEKLRKLGTLLDVAKAGPKRVRSAPCQEVVETANPSVAALPVLQCWPGDAGRYITLPLVFTRDPATGARNVGMYRLQVYDERTLGMHWQIHKGSAEHHRVAEERGGARMEVAIALGGDPVSIYSGSAPLPPGVDEMVFAGWLRGAGVPMVACKTVDLEVPAEAEIVLEGWVDPAERRLEGPFGDHTGYYSLARDYPVFHLQAVTRRNASHLSHHHRGPAAAGGLLAGQGHRADLPADHPPAAPGGRRHEHARRGRVPQPRDRLHPEAVSGPRAQGHVRPLGPRAHDAGQEHRRGVASTWTSRTSPRWPGGPPATWTPSAISCSCDGPTDDLDHAAIRHRFGGKLGIDATEKTDADGIGQPWPEEIVMSDETRARVTRRWTEYGL